MANRPGPVPKHSSERTRRNKTDEAGLELKKGVAFGVPFIPEPNPEWEPQTIAFYRSLADSGMSRFYELSDWGTAIVLCDALDEFYRRPAGNRSWQMIDIVLKHMASLGTTEGERRRMRIELEPEMAPEKSASEKARERWKKDLAKPASTVVPLGMTEEGITLDRAD